MLPIASRQGIGRLLVENCLERHPEPLYVQLLDPESEALEFFTQCRFEELRRSPTRAFLRGSPVEVVSMWLGVDSPDAIRQLPVKSKGRLALTYAVLRKAASNPGLLQLAGSLGSSRTAAKVIPLALQTTEYVEAKKDLDEAEDRLQELRVELAQDDDLYSGLDEVVKEQEAAVQQLRERFEALTRALAKERKARSGSVATRSRTPSFSSKLGRTRKKLAASGPVPSHSPALGYGVSSPALLQNGEASLSFPARPLPVPSRALPLPPTSAPSGLPPAPDEQATEDHCQELALEAAAAAQSFVSQRTLPVPPAPASSADREDVGRSLQGHRPLPPPPSDVSCATPVASSAQADTPTTQEEEDAGVEPAAAGTTRQLPAPPPTLSQLAAKRREATAAKDNSAGTDELAMAPGSLEAVPFLPQRPLPVPRQPLPVPQGVPSRPLPAPARPLPVPGRPLPSPGDADTS